MERKLAGIQRVLAIEPILNADAIELARISGWQCVVKKGVFKPGDLGLYLEIDAVPPESDAFRFLWQPRPVEGITVTTLVERPANYRVRTMKLRGTLSQGVLLPLADFDFGEVEAGQDMTEVLGVTKYEPPVKETNGGFSEYRAEFPGFLSKTDEMRVQSVPEVLDELRGLPYVATLKYDGTSATFCIDPRDGEFHACSRNMSILDGESVYWRVARKYGLETVLRRCPGLAVQGEICGPGIQKNRLGLKELTLFIFNIYDIPKGRYLEPGAERRWLLETGLTGVEIVEAGEAFAHSQETLLGLAEGKYPGTTNEREGIVIRPLRETRSEVLAGRLSFKAISNRFLLKGGD